MMFHSFFACFVYFFLFFCAPQISRHALHRMQAWAAAVCRAPSDAVGLRFPIFILQINMQIPSQACLQPMVFDYCLPNRLRAYRHVFFVLYSLLVWWLFSFVRTTYASSRIRPLRHQGREAQSIPYLVVYTVVFIVNSAHVDVIRILHSLIGNNLLMKITSNLLCILRPCQPEEEPV